MLNCSEQEKAEYLSPKIEMLAFCSADIITTSGNWGGSDDAGDGSDIDKSGWT